MINKNAQRIKRHNRVKKVLNSNTSSHRLVVFRSNKHIYAQAIDLTTFKTIAGKSDVKSKISNKIESAREVGLEIGKQLTKKNIQKIVFDRAGYKYHGRIKALAEGAREGGLKF